MFKPKTNTLNIHSVQDVWTKLDEICKNEKKYTDDELSKKLKEVYDFCNGGESGRDFYLISHHRSDEIVKQRVVKYCKKNKIKIENYTGLLPYRMFIIDKLEVRRLKLEKIIKKIKQKTKKINIIGFLWKNIFGKVN